MNYEEMSDYELSCEIMDAIHGEQIKNWCLSDCEKYIYDCGPIGEDFHKIDMFDINNPADMWPIIFEHGISLLQQDNEDGWCAFRWDDDNAECWHKNPLRAAAIVFLMMKDAEKAN